MHAPSDWSSSEAKNEFSRKLSQLPQIMHATDCVVVVGDFNVQTVYSAEMEWNAGGSYFSPSDLTDNDDHLIQVSPDYGLFLANTRLS